MDTGNRNNKKRNRNTHRNKNKNNRKNTVKVPRNDLCFFDSPTKYESCLEQHISKKGFTLKLGSILVRNDKGGAKAPSAEVPAFFGDEESTLIYGANHKNPTSRYRIVKQPRLLNLDAIPLIAMAKDAFGPTTKEEKVTILAYLSPPVNEETTYPPDFDEDNDVVVRPMGFITQENLNEYRAKGQGLYINRKLANIVCRLGFDGWIALPGSLYQWVPSRNQVIPYAPEIMLCRWTNFMEPIA